MENERIENNSSFKKLKKDFEGATAIHRVVKFFELFGIKNKELSEALDSLAETKKQFELLSKAPDKFNSHFAKKGWIAFESMNQDLMLTANSFADKGHQDVAEQALINYYSSDQMHWLVMQLRGVPAFNKRYELIERAYDDTLEGRYHAAIPVVLMMMDGAVNDVDKSKGFFADNTELTAWDSIAAHSTGLKVLKEILSDTRKTTCEEEIAMPYRHGILHGRDLGYANKTVAAKTWAAIFAVKDWARAVQDGKKEVPVATPQSTFKETVQGIKQSLDKINQNKEVSKKLNAWQARNLKIGIDIPEKANSNEYQMFTPEQEAIRFAEYWTNGKYGLISKQIHHFSRKDISEKKEAGKVRKAFEGKNIIDYKITKVVDCAPAISEVSIATIIDYEGKTYERNITLRLLYQDSEGEFLILGTEGGQWKFLEGFFYQIESLY